MIKKALGFIGTGNMGSAIIKGVLKSGKFNDVFGYDINPNSSLNVKYLPSIKEIIENCEYIVFCIKPNIFKSVVDEIKKLDYNDRVFISIAAGITKDFIKNELGDITLTRVMPNLPLCVGEGMSVVCPDDKMSSEQLDTVKTIFESSGKMCIMAEDYINKAIAVNGSGPAYVFMFIEAMADALVKNGIDRKTSYKMSAQTVLGSAKMVLDLGLHPAEFKDMVCSPAGTTIDAVIELEKQGFRYSVMEAVKKCTDKADYMSKNK